MSNDDREPLQNEEESMICFIFLNLLDSQFPSLAALLSFYF